MLRATNSCETTSIYMQTRKGQEVNVSHIPAVLIPVHKQPKGNREHLVHLVRRNADSGTIFVTLLSQAIASGMVVIDDGSKTQPSGLVIAHWLPGWEALPIYPEHVYALVEQLAMAQGISLGNPEQVWSDLEHAGLLTRAWNGKPLNVRWRGGEVDVFIIPLSALSMAADEPYDATITADEELL